MKTPLLKSDCQSAEIELINHQLEKHESKERKSSESKEVMNNCSFDMNNSTFMNHSICDMPTSKKQGDNDANRHNQTILSPNQTILSSPNQSMQSACNTTASNGLNSSILCRICYSADNSREPLLHPCNCSGTMGLIHRTCLEKWLSQSNSNRCEICSFEFTIEKELRTFSQWLIRPISSKDNKNLLNDFVCFLILTPLAFLSIWYCVLFAFKFDEAENKWEACGLVVLTTFLLFIYVLWFIFSTKYHYKVFKEWQRKNQIVTLKLNDERVVLTSPVVARETSHQNQLFINQSNSRETLITNSHNEDQTSSSNSSEHQQLISLRQLSEQSANRSLDSYEIKLKPQNNEECSPCVV